MSDHNMRELTSNETEQVSGGAGGYDAMGNPTGGCIPDPPPPDPSGGGGRQSATPGIRG